MQYLINEGAIDYKNMVDPLNKFRSDYSIFLNEANKYMTGLIATRYSNYDSHFKIITHPSNRIWFLGYYRFNGMYDIGDKLKNLSYKLELIFDDDNQEQRKALIEKIDNTIIEVDKYIVKYGNYIRKSLKNFNISDDFLVSYSYEVIGNDFMNKLKHFYSLNVPEINNVIFTGILPDEVIDKMTSIEETWNKDSLKIINDYADPNIDKNTTLIQYNDGSKWVSLNRSACSVEGAAMGHCGNSYRAGWSGLNVYSYRTPALNNGRPIKDKNSQYWEPHLTFIVNANNGELIEAKGRGNARPSKRYFEVIADFLIKSPVERIVYKQSNYEAGGDFVFDEMSETLQHKVLDAKPEIMDGEISVYDIWNKDKNDPTLLKLINEKLYNSSLPAIEHINDEKIILQYFTNIDNDIKYHYGNSKDSEFIIGLIDGVFSKDGTFDLDNEDIENFITSVENLSFNEDYFYYSVKNMNFSDKVAMLATLGISDYKEPQIDLLLSEAILDDSYWKGIMTVSIAKTFIINNREYIIDTLLQNYDIGNIGVFIEMEGHSKTKGEVVTNDIAGFLSSLSDINNDADDEYESYDTFFEIMVNDIPDWITLAIIDGTSSEHNNIEMNIEYGDTNDMVDMIIYKCFDVNSLYYYIDMTDENRGFDSGLSAKYFTKMIPMFI